MRHVKLHYLKDHGTLHPTYLPAKEHFQENDLLVDFSDVHKKIPFETWKSREESEMKH